MHIDRCRSGKYERILLRDSYRENGKNRHHTILNLTHWPKNNLHALELALKHKNDLRKIAFRKDDMTLGQGMSVGAVHLVKEVAKRLGIESVLGVGRDGKLAMWQVIARVINQGSRLSSVRLAGHHAGNALLHLDAFNEDSLYANLEWLCCNQTVIEDRLFRLKHRNKKPGLYLYDVTSSYFEGDKNELAAFGYNRDGKKGKRQIVVGLLCDEDGSPISIEVFRGNTVDMKTVSSQIRKISERFDGAEITLVGDRGMIKRPQMAELNEKNFHYITAITKAQVERLLKDGALQMELFDESVSEIITNNGERYVCRRNPFRADEISLNRKDKIGRLEYEVRNVNERLATHPKASTATAVKKINSVVNRLKMGGWIMVIAEARIVRLKLDGEKLAEASRLDGCYVLKTDLSAESADKNIIHDRYKDLAFVEQAFRTSKTVELELRPIYLRNGERTRGHTLVVMLAYQIVRELAKCWSSLDLTVEEGITQLSSLCSTDVIIENKVAFSMVPEPRRTVKKLFDLAGVRSPNFVPNTEAKAVTKVKLQNRR
jgi:hypothetical protein